MFDISADHPAAQDVFAAAKPLLDGVDPRKLARAGGDRLHVNRIGQILAAWRLWPPGGCWATRNPTG